MMASCEAIAAKCTGNRWLGVFYIDGIERIVFAEFSAIHTKSTAFVNIHPEWIYIFKQVHDSSNGAIHNAMNHLFLF